MPAALICHAFPRSRCLCARSPRATALRRRDLGPSRLVEFSSGRGQPPPMRAAPATGARDQAEPGETREQRGGVALAVDAHAESDLVVAETWLGADGPERRDGAVVETAAATLQQVESFPARLPRGSLLPNRDLELNSCRREPPGVVSALGAGV